MPFVKVESKEFEDFFEDFVKRSENGFNAERIVNDVLHNEGADEIKEQIHRLLPVSGRKWKRKKVAAKATMPFSKIDYLLGVEVRSDDRHGYLYFPDDGSNTIHHFGGQQFMLRGANNATEKIVDLCLGKLMEEMNGGN